MTGNAGGEGSGKAEIETGFDLCYLPCWSVDLGGYEDYPPLQQVWDVEGIGSCSWFYDGLPSPSGEDSNISISENLVMGALVIEVFVHITIDIDLGIESNALYRLDKEDVDPFGPNLFPLISSSGPWTVPDELPVVPCPTINMAGNAGGEGDGKAKIGVNEMTGNAGVEIDGKAEIETS